MKRVLTRTEMEEIVMNWVAKLDAIDVYNIAAGVDSFANWGEASGYKDCINYEHLVYIADSIVGEMVNRRLENKKVQVFVPEAEETVAYMA